MQEYNILIEEHISETFKVQANSKEEALQTAEEKYRNCEFVLEPGKLIDVAFNIE